MPRLHLIAQADVGALVGVALPRGDAIAEEDAGVRLGDDDARPRGPQGDGGVLCVVVVWWYSVCRGAEVDTDVTLWLTIIIIARPSVPTQPPLPYQFMLAHASTPYKWLLTMIAHTPNQSCLPPLPSGLIQSHHEIMPR